ncbi:MAG: hypothetical protein ACI32N_05430 [Bulleidia sp.]
MKQYFQAVYWLPLVKRAYAVVPEWIRKQPLVNRISNYVLSERFFTDALYRTEFLLYPGFAANLLYAAMQLVLAIFYRSIWSGALAVYYAMLAVMRVQLLKPMKHNTVEKKMLSELRRYRCCGIILLCMTPLFATILILVVHKNGGTQYPGFTILIMEIYTVCLVVSSISNLVKFRKYKRPAMSAAKVVCLTAALMSVLFLATALVDKLGRHGSDCFKQGLVGTVGGSVCVIVLTMAIHMAVQSSKQFKLLQKESKKEDEVSNSLNKQQI